MDKLRLNGIEVLCIIGDLPNERLREQRLMVDVELELDLSAAARSDDLADTVDYAELSRRIREVLRAAQCRLVERAAHLAAEVCLEDRRVCRTTVSVRKSGSVRGLTASEVVLARGRAAGEGEGQP